MVSGPNPSVFLFFLHFGLPFTHKRCVGWSKTETFENFWKSKMNYLLPPCQWARRSFQWKPLRDTLLLFVHYIVILIFMRAQNPTSNNSRLLCYVCASESTHFIQSPSECVSVTSSLHSAKTLSVHTPDNQPTSTLAGCLSTNLLSFQFFHVHNHFYSLHVKPNLKGNTFAFLSCVV